MRQVPLHISISGINGGISDTVTSVVAALSGVTEQRSPLTFILCSIIWYTRSLSFTNTISALFVRDADTVFSHATRSTTVSNTRSSETLPGDRVREDGLHRSTSLLILVFHLVNCASDTNSERWKKKLIENFHLFLHHAPHATLIHQLPTSPGETARARERERENECSKDFYYNCYKIVLPIYTSLTTNKYDKS